MSDNTFSKNTPPKHSQDKARGIISRSPKGSLQWNQTYVEPTGRANSVIETINGGYALAGWTGGFLTDKFWLMKTNSIGIEQWAQTYKRECSSRANEVIQTIDGEFVIVGTITSYEVDSSDTCTGTTRSYETINFDIWLIKTDTDGKVQWNRTYGGSGHDEAYTIIQTVDGGFAIVGSTESYGAGGMDFWLIKTGSDGIPQWNRTYGGLEHDIAHSGIQTVNGGFVLTGESRALRTSSSGRVWAYPVGWLVKTDEQGELQWTYTYDKFASDWVSSVIQTTDGGIVFTRNTDILYARIDIMPGDPGGYEVWLTKISPDGEFQWTQTYNKQTWDVVSEVIQTTDGGFALAGSKILSDDSWLIITDEYGVLQWNQTYKDIEIFAMIQSRDGGLVFTGNTRLIKTISLDNSFFNRYMFGLSVVIILTALIALGVKRKRK